MLTLPSLTLTLVPDRDLINQMFAHWVSKVETRGLSGVHYFNFTATSNKAFRHNQKPLISDHWGHLQGKKCPEKQPWNMLYRPQTPLNSPGTWAIHHIYQWSWVTTCVPVHCCKVWDSPGPGPFGQVTLGQKEMVCTSLSKILTVSKNPQTNMFLLIVGQLRYPEVLLPQSKSISAFKLFLMVIFWFYCKIILYNSTLNNKLESTQQEFLFALICLVSK